MTTASCAGLAAIGLFAAGMIYAGFMDLRTMRIPNGIIVLLILDFMLAATLAGWGIQEIGVSLAVGLSAVLPRSSTCCRAAGRRTDNRLARA